MCLDQWHVFKLLFISLHIYTTIVLTMLSLWNNKMPIERLCFVKREIQCKRTALLKTAVKLGIWNICHPYYSFCFENAGFNFYWNTVPNVSWQMCFYHIRIIICLLRLLNRKPDNCPNKDIIPKMCKKYQDTTCTTNCL
jgi:hypothetical protein